jgi:Holliday junction resolvase RusA-like endonuclease
MIKPLRITITEEPVPKGRARTIVCNGQVRTYNPERTENAQDAISWHLMMRHAEDCFPKDTPLKLTAIFYRTKSKYLPKRETLPFRKPDLDNYLKMLLDSMNSILFYDDAQITTMHIRKRWTDKDMGYIEIRLEEDRCTT